VPADSPTCPNNPFFDSNYSSVDRQLFSFSLKYVRHAWNCFSLCVQGFFLVAGKTFFRAQAAVLGRNPFIFNYAITFVGGRNPKEAIPQVAFVCPQHFLPLANSIYGN